MLVALKTYQSGHGEKGKLRWTVTSTICDALEEAFYTSFKVCFRWPWFQGLKIWDSKCCPVYIHVYVHHCVHISIEYTDCSGPHALPIFLQFVEPTGKRFLLAIDVSGSMHCDVLGSAAVTAREASAAMAMVTARREPNYHIVGFSDELVPIDITAKMSLKNVLDTIDAVRYSTSSVALFQCF